MPNDIQDDPLLKSTQATIYHALEDKIQRHHTFGFLQSDSIRGSPATKYAATPRDALAARLGTTSNAIPTPPPDTNLPSSDLLDAIHGYTSRLFTLGFPHALRGMDESALLLIGIIVEELAEEVIGAQGHLMLQEIPHKSSQETGSHSNSYSHNDAHDYESEQVEEFTWINPKLDSSIADGIIPEQSKENRKRNVEEDIKKRKRNKKRKVK